MAAAPGCGSCAPRGRDPTARRLGRPTMTDPSTGIVRVLGFAGSLRKTSYNRALLAAAQAAAPPDMAITIFDLAEVPLYNGDVEAQGDPAAVAALKQAIR